MKILWVSNIPFGSLFELAGQSKSNSGSWLDAAFDALSNDAEIELTVVTVSRIKEIRTKKEGRHSFYILPGGHPSEYNPESNSNRKNWEFLKKECQPDLIQIWGTEYRHGYLALQVIDDIPAVIYMQGLMSQIANHYLSGISENELRKFITLRDVLKWDWIKKQKARFEKGAFFEAKMLQLAGNVIVENDWCAAHCAAITPNLKVFKSKLSIKNEFYNYEWDEKKMVPFTIMTNAGGYPIKGLHILLKALSLVVKKYPNTKLLIPGEKSLFNQTFIERCKINGYKKYLIFLIEKLQLKNNIIFLGNLSTEQMATQMSKSNVFVMPSSIENHSSTLIEAMIVGVPSVSSYVGGIPEYLYNDINGLIYRFEEYQVLAYHIEKVFGDNSLATRIGLEAKITMRASRNSDNLCDELINIYKNILNYNN